MSGAAQADTIRRAQEVRRDGVALFSSVQATWNLLERSAGDALAEAHRAGVGVIVKEALANGRLTERNPDPLFAPRLALLRIEAARLGVGVDAVALAAARARPWADVVLSGAATREHLRANLLAASLPWDPEADRRLSSLGEEPAEYWAVRGRLPWN